MAVAAWIFLAVGVVVCIPVPFVSIALGVLVLVAGYAMLEKGSRARRALLVAVWIYLALLITYVVAGWIAWVVL